MPPSLRGKLERMYVPSHFAVDPDEARAQLAAGVAGNLVTPTAQGLQATFLPLLLSEDGRAMLGHVARNNPHWQAIPSGDSLLIIDGPDAYVSPSYYPSKQTNGRVVPTWNYVTLQVHGSFIVHDDPEWLRTFVTRLTDWHESGLDQPWSVTDAPPDYLDGMLRAIVGIELQITRIEGKAKLSQNRPAADRAGTIEGLTRQGSPAAVAVAEQMRTLG
ncbi:MAG: FMN-binding negative transcriptional regulator [Frankiales bacterium]|nr:FMN-binding negative transcriptional regulator [Frankiales bacterium]